VAESNGGAENALENMETLSGPAIIDAEAGGGLVTAMRLAMEKPCGGW